MKEKVALIVGASSGFGRAAALALLAEGFTVYAAARRLAPMEEVGRAGGRLLAMDVTREASVNDGIKTILEETGRIDVVLNNAGYGAYGAIETVPVAEIMRQFDVNLFGMARVNNAVLPVMRAQRSGRIVLSASVASHISAPGTGWYAATKHAVKAMAEALRSEVAALGIFVVQIEPGPVRTGFESVAFEAMDRLQHPRDYQPIIGGFRRFMAQSYAKAPGPRSTVRAMVTAATARRPRAVYRTTPDAKALPVIRAVLGGALFGAILRAVFLRRGAQEGL